MYAILGADDEIDFGIPNISFRLISESVGCTAPHSIQATEAGLTWMYHRTPYLYDGTVPKPLQAHRIKRTLSKIPAKRKAKIVSVNDTKERELNLFYTIPDGTTGGSQYNRGRSRFNWFTGKWTHDVLPVGVGYAVEVKDDDSEGHVLWGVDDIPLVVFAQSRVVLRADSGFQDGKGFSQSSASIPLSFQTAFLDDGRPFEDKRWLSMIVETNSQIPLTIDVLVDNRYDSRSTGAGIVLAPPAADGALVWGVGQWGVNTWGAIGVGGTKYRAIQRFGDTIPVGKSISLIGSGQNVYDPVEIYSITIFYKSEGVRVQ
jgi:hypothetical protein